MKKLFVSGNETDGLSFLLFEHDGLDLHVLFTGKVKKNVLIEIPENKYPSFVRAVESYINIYDDSILKDSKTLDFGNIYLRIKVNKRGRFVEVLVRIIPSGNSEGFYKWQAYKPSEKDYILWQIANAGEDFKLNY